MKLAFVKSDGMFGHEDDWYVIQRAEHDGREWWRKTESGCEVYCCSSRLGNATVEGTLAEMLDIAAAIRERQDLEWKRCAVRFRPEGVQFYSPRNSTSYGPFVTLAEADALADHIEQTAREVQA